MMVGVVDIGTNTMRLLITNGLEEGRYVEVTGLGRGVDEAGILDESAMAATVDALARFGSIMDEAGAGRRLAIATSASRDASNRESFFDRCRDVLGVRPTLISGQEEARLAYEGAVSGIVGPGPVLVSDIGGGSTEFVWDQGQVSIDIGSVRLTERVIPNRPPPRSEIDDAMGALAGLFADLPTFEGSLVGVAGTWTSLAGIDLGEAEGVHGHVLGADRIGEMVEMLAGLSVSETADLAGLDPRRAPVILGGALVAAAVLKAAEAPEATVSVQDTLDGAAMRLLALA